MPRLHQSGYRRAHAPRCLETSNDNVDSHARYGAYAVVFTVTSTSHVQALKAFDVFFIEPSCVYDAIINYNYLCATTAVVLPVLV